jgi:dTDP-4-dehydrorhamnose 3,5-epimerase
LLDEIGFDKRFNLSTKITSTLIPDLLILEARQFGDERGFFAETWNSRVLAAAGIDVGFVQDNHSFSVRSGTVRGLHFQAPPHAQAKLVRCGRGRLMDVAVDIRSGSPTYGKWFGVELSFDNGKQLYIPAGFAHGFATLEPATEIVYKCSDYYAPECEGALRFDDPDLGIEWGLSGQPTAISEKDLKASNFKGFESPFIWTETKERTQYGI